MDTTLAEGLTYGDILERYKKLEAVKDLTGARFLYARSKNLMKLRSFYNRNSSDAKIPVTNGFREFQREIITLRNKHIIPAEEGKPASVNVQSDEYKEQAAALEAKYKDVIESRDLDIQVYRDLLKEPIPASEMPEIYFCENDGAELNQEQMEAVWWFLKTE